MSAAPATTAMAYSPAEAPGAAAAPGGSGADTAADDDGGTELANETFNTLLSEALADAQAAVMAAKVPISGYGRVKDAFEHLRPLISKLCSDLVTAELVSLRRSSSEALEAQRVAMEEQRIAEVTQTLERVTAERDLAVSEAETARAVAEAAAAAATEQYETLLKREDGSEMLIAKSEAELAACEEKLAAATARGDKSVEQLTRAEERLKGISDEWEEKLAESLELCTLKSKKELPKTDEQKGRVGRVSRERGEPLGAGSIKHTQRNELKQLGPHRSQMWSELGEDQYGGKLALLLAAYEEARTTVSEARKQDQEEAAVAVAAQVAQKEEAEKLWEARVREVEQQLRAKDQEKAGVQKLLKEQVKTWHGCRRATEAHTARRARTRHVTDGHSRGLHRATPLQNPMHVT